MREAEFLNQFFRLLDAHVIGLNLEQKLHFMQKVVDEIPRTHEQKSLIKCHIVPFVTGRRPTEEACYPGLGSSDNTSLILSNEHANANYTYILYSINHLDAYAPEVLQEMAIEVTLSFCGSDGKLLTMPIPGWNKRQIQPSVFESIENDKPVLKPITLAEVQGRCLVLPFSPSQDFLPGKTWSWEELDKSLQEAATNDACPFTFGHLFTQKILVQICITSHQVPIASAHTWIDVCDMRRYGSLYQRIRDYLIKPDTMRQAQKAKIDQLEEAYHPWFPVLAIGSAKIALYTQSLIKDIVHKEHYLTDPNWLMRIGLYLEFLTFLGIVETVREDVGDLLSPEEREVYENSPLFHKIRTHLNLKGWREVWNLREINFSKFGVPQMGPVSALNLLQKRKATLAFLEAHHQDLKHAIELAGQNIHNAQETWYRVFRDAERAVLSKTPEAFPELNFMNPLIKDFVLWHEKGKLSLPILKWIPKSFVQLFGDQDGLFASACNKYRDSLNEVAAWSKNRHLMDYTGKECISSKVSLLQAYMNGQQELIERLQKQDGYIEKVNVETQLLEEYRNSTEQIYTLLSEIPLFQILSEEERAQLARTARMIHLASMERIIVQGREGSSLFIVSEGQLEVFVRQADGTDQLVNTLIRGDIFGEMSLLTGTPRSATVRAVEGAVVFEIGKQQYEPIIRSRPELVEMLSRIMENRLKELHQQREAYEAQLETAHLNQRIWYFFFGQGMS